MRTPIGRCVSYVHVVLGQTGSPQAGVCRRLLADGEASRQNAATDELRELALAALEAVAVEPPSLSAEFVECLSGTLKIGTAIAAVSKKFQTAKLRRGFRTLPATGRVLR
jgi:hypothetical protein